MSRRNVEDLFPVLTVPLSSVVALAILDHSGRGLIGNPRILFLDEPTNGMDPVAAHDFRALVK